MSRRANPTLIGSFILLVLALLVVGVVALVPRLLGAHRPTFLSFFEESVHGLEVGAAVKFQGVPVGNVVRIGLRVDPGELTSSVPVHYRIDLRRLESARAAFVELDDPEVLRRHVGGGLRAQLQMESFVTGLLFVNLAYVEDPPPPTVPVAEADLPVIPTVPSRFLALEAQALELASAARALLQRANRMMDDVDAAGVSEALVASARAVEQLAAAPEIRAALREVPAVAAQLSATMAEVQLLSERLGGAIDPLAADVRTAAAEAILVLQTMRGSLEAVSGAVSTDAGIGYRVEEALISIVQAAEAIRRLADSLERDPSMLIRGRAPER